MSEDAEIMKVITPYMHRQAMKWKPRIYKKFRTIRGFIEYLGEKGIKVNEKQFSAWLNGHNRPHPHYFKAVEGKLKELGV